MWFKNLTLLQLSPRTGDHSEQLENELASASFKPCGKVTPQSTGWVPPLGDAGSPLVHVAYGHFMMICLKIQEKVLPTSVVREALSEKVHDMESTEGRKLFRKEKERMKDEVYYTLLSQAFTQSQRVYAYLDPASGWMVIDTASQKVIDCFMKKFTQSVKCYQAEFPEINSPPAVITQWLKKNRFPRHFEGNDSCVIEDFSDKKGVVRLKHKDLLADNVLSFLREGAHVTQLTLTWLEQIQFTLKHDFTLSGVKFLEAVQDLAKDGLTETPEERFAADFAIMSETLRKFIDDLTPHFLADLTQADDTEGAAEQYVPAKKETATAA